MKQQRSCSDWNEPVRKIEFFDPFAPVADEIDLPQVLDRLRGNRKLLFKLLQSFAANYAETMKKIGEALDREDETNARDLIHVVRGVAANLSAWKLERIALELSDAVKEGRKDARLAKFKELETAFERIADSVGKLDANSRMTEPKTPAFGLAAEHDLDVLSGILSCLYEYLSEFNIEAEFYLESSMPELLKRFSRQDLAIIESEIANFDFESASASLRKMTKRAGIFLAET